jgi:hypothetical protein
VRRCLDSPEELTASRGIRVRWAVAEEPEDGVMEATDGYACEWRVAGCYF